MSEATAKVGMFRGRLFSLERLPTDPTPEQIAAGCERIRATWSAAETRRRSRWAHAEPVEMEFVGADSIGLDPGYRD